MDPDEHGYEPPHSATWQGVGCPYARQNPSFEQKSIGRVLAGPAAAMPEEVKYVIVRA